MDQNENSKISVNSLLGIHLQSDFRRVIAMLGEPEMSDFSPEGEQVRYGTYSWQRLGLSVLTWLTGDDEIVWGVRLDRPGTADSALGFGVGSAREDVLARLPPGWRKKSGDAVVAVDGGSLTVSFENNRVSTIQLMAPME